MKAFLRFLLNTGVGREITRAMIQAIIRLFKRKVLQRVESYKRENIERVLELADKELHADIETGRVNLKEVI